MRKAFSPFYICIIYQLNHKTFNKNLVKIYFDILADCHISPQRSEGEIIIISQRKRRLRRAAVAATRQQCKAAKLPACSFRFDMTSREISCCYLSARVFYICNYITFVKGIGQKSWPRVDIFCIQNGEDKLARDGELSEK